MRISDWSSDVCSSDLFIFFLILGKWPTPAQTAVVDACLIAIAEHGFSPGAVATRLTYMGAPESMQGAVAAGLLGVGNVFVGRSEEHTSELQSLMRISYAVFCLKKKKRRKQQSSTKYTYT